MLRAPLARALFLTSASVGRRGAHAEVSMMGSGANQVQRLQSLLDSVDGMEAPRIELTNAAAAPVTPVAVLDSSFNPPTRAHLHMLSVAASRFSCTNTLLLLAKQNADKAVTGASLVQRLEMMELIAAAAEPVGSMLCGVTAHPLFVDKVSALRSLYGSGSGDDDARILVLVGFDTWIRIVDPKYYPPNGGLEAALKAIFGGVDVCVVSRDPSSASNLAESADALSVEAQESIVHSLSAEVTNGRLHFLRNEPEFAGVSSSAIRKAVAGGGASASGGVPESIAAYVAEQGLYRD